MNNLQNEINRIREEIDDIKEIVDKTKDLSICAKLDDHLDRLERRLLQLMLERFNDKLNKYTSGQSSQDKRSHHST